MEPIIAEQLIEQAVAATGHDDFDTMEWREALDRMIDSWEHEANLNDIGRMMVESTTVQFLTNRLNIVAYRKAHPEIARRDITPPIVIVGQARTGTTILFDLLAQDPAVRVPRTWEVDMPSPPPQTATYESDPRIDIVEASTAATDMIIPGFRAIHPMGARLAQECVTITASAFRSAMFPTVYRMPSYGNWLLYEADMAPAYRWHRTFLQHLQAHHRGERWLLKTPGHIWCLESLLAEYPDAILVQTHRDPLRVIASVSSLQAVLRRLASDTTDLHDIASDWAEWTMEGFDRSVRARRDAVVNSKRVVDVNFDAFMADPFVAIGAIYDQLGLPFTADAERRMREFLANHRQDEHGRHHYTWEGTGLDRQVWRERAESYQEYFNVPSEVFV